MWPLPSYKVSSIRAESGAIELSFAKYLNFTNTPIFIEQLNLTSSNLIFKYCYSESLIQRFSPSNIYYNGNFVALNLIYASDCVSAKGGQIVSTMPNTINHKSECNYTSLISSVSILESTIFYYGNILSNFLNFSDIVGSGIHAGYYPIKYDFSYINVMKCRYNFIYDESDKESGRNNYVNLVNNTSTQYLLYFYGYNHNISNFVIKNNTYPNLINSQNYCVYENIFVDNKVNIDGLTQKDTNTYDINIEQINTTFDYEPKCFKRSVQNLNINFYFRNLFHVFILLYID